MRRWVVIATVVATFAGIGGLGTGPARAATVAAHQAGTQAGTAAGRCHLLCRCGHHCDHDGDGGDGGDGGAGIGTTAHDPIVISGDGGFTQANGVTNPAGCGTADNPCQIDHWEITPRSGGTCISVANTTKVYVVHDNSCTGGTNGIVVRRAPNGTVRDNSVSRLLGVILTATDATGILVDSSNDVTVTGNRLATITGSSGAGIGQKGGSAFGIHVLGGHRVDIRQNTINPVTGGTGFPAIGFGQSGANGGNADGIVAENMTATSSGGAFGPLSTVVGALLDLIGPALSELFGPVLAAPANLNVEGNTISALNGGGGGAGSFSGTPGGNGGSAEGVLLTAVAGSAVTTNTISSLRGANGGNGTGARGGNGGNAYGVHRVNSSVTPQNNQITLLTAGTGGTGFPAGQNGTARNIV